MSLFNQITDFLKPLQELIVPATGVQSKCLAVWGSTSHLSYPMRLVDHTQPDAVAE